MSRVVKFFRLELKDQYLLLYTAILVQIVRLALYIFRFPKVHKFLMRIAPQPEGREPNEAPNNLRSIWALEVVSNVLLGNKPCLTKALVGQMLLARQNYPTSLRISVMKTSAGKLQAHAWLESDGKVIVGDLPELSTYSAFPPISTN